MARAPLILVIAAASCSACGAGITLVLHAPEHRNLAAADTPTGKTVICVTHKTRLRGKLPARETGHSAASLDYDGSAGGSLGIDQSSAGVVSITCS